MSEEIDVGEDVGGGGEGGGVVEGGFAGGDGLGTWQVVTHHPREQTHQGVTAVGGFGAGQPAADVPPTLPMTQGGERQ